MNFKEDIGDELLLIREKGKSDLGKYTDYLNKSNLLYLVSKHVKFRQNVYNYHNFKVEIEGDRYVKVWLEFGIKTYIIKYDMECLTPMELRKNKIKKILK